MLQRLVGNMATQNYKLQADEIVSTLRLLPATAKPKAVSFFNFIHAIQTDGRPVVSSKLVRPSVRLSVTTRPSVTSVTRPSVRWCGVSGRNRTATSGCRDCPPSQRRLTDGRAAAPPPHGVTDRRPRPERMPTLIGNDWAEHTRTAATGAGDVTPARARFRRRWGLLTADGFGAVRHTDSVCCVG